MSTVDAVIVRIKTYDINICSATVLSHAKIQGENMSQIQTFNVNITTLNRERKVWVYLPDGYSEKGTPYPVIYMHDGQNLFFDSCASYGASWKVGETMDELCQKGFPAIVVGVECDSALRLTEYSPWKINFFAFRAKRTDARRPNNGGQGALYAEYFATSLKQLIDSSYNTDKARQATAVAGSSMGGLISCYLGLKYQETYETMGLFSTYTEFNQVRFDAFVRSTKQRLPQHAFVYCGGKEWDHLTTDKRMLRNSLSLYNTLSKRKIHSKLVFDSQMKHFETAWSVYFKQFATDFLQRYYNGEKTE